MFVRYSAASTKLRSNTMSAAMLTGGVGWLPVEPPEDPISSTRRVAKIPTASPSTIPAGASHSGHGGPSQSELGSGGGAAGGGVQGAAGGGTLLIERPMVGPGTSDGRVRARRARGRGAAISRLGRAPDPLDDPPPGDHEVRPRGRARPAAAVAAAGTRSARQGKQRIDVLAAAVGRDQPGAARERFLRRASLRRRVDVKHER